MGSIRGRQPGLHLTPAEQAGLLTLLDAMDPSERCQPERIAEVVSHWESVCIWRRRQAHGQGDSSAGLQPGEWHHKSPSDWR
jgi:hypothetical protein